MLLPLGLSPAWSCITAFGIFSDVSPDPLAGWTPAYILVEGGDSFPTVSSLTTMTITSFYLGELSWPPHSAQHGTKKAGKLLPDILVAWLTPWAHHEMGI